MIEKMLERFNQLHPLSDELKERIISVFTVKEYPKKSIILHEGQVANHASVVLKGLARAFYVVDGKEITSRFMDEGFIITSWISFYTRKPGYEIIETLEDSVLACLHYDEVEKIYADFIEFNVIVRKFVEYFFFLAEHRTQMLRKHTTDEKYQFFINQHPSLLQRVPLKYIATYLGMSEETLSRVRAKTSKPVKID